MAKIDQKLFNLAKKYIAGGVNSPIRAFKRVGGAPVFIKSARGSKLYSESGQSFIDYCQGYGALILGHAHPEVVKELEIAVRDGFIFGAPTKKETELAKLIINAVPAIERLRLTNSGTEAVMGAIRLARAYTGRNKIIRFEGCYHGHADYLLRRQIPAGFTRDTLVSPYNNIGKAKELIQKYHRDLAALIIEPVAGNMGVVLPEEGFLEELRQLTRKYNIVLIFDEVITGFRFAFGGSQKVFGISPDLTCLGKIIGGGLPIGAFGGRKEIMALLAPEGEVYQAGTFSGNPLSVSAGLATLKILSRDNPYPKLAQKTEKLCKDILEAAKAAGISLKINFKGPIFSLSFSRKDLFRVFFHQLLKEGIYLSPSSLEADFISTAHTDQDINKTIQVVKRAFRNIK